MSGPIPPASSPLAAAWSLDPAVTYLNHGSFGAAPRAVLARQAELAARLERNPKKALCRFFSSMFADGELPEAELFVIEKVPSSEMDSK